MSPGNPTPLTNGHTPRAYQFVEVADVQQLIADATAPLLERLAKLEGGQAEWVDTKEALRLTGLKSGDTLKRERERPGTRVVFKMEGRTSTTPRYLRDSLLAYSEAKIKRRLNGRDLLNELLGGQPID